MFFPKKFVLRGKNSVFPKKDVWWYFVMVENWMYAKFGLVGKMAFSRVCMVCGTMGNSEKTMGENIFEKHQ